MAIDYGAMLNLLEGSNQDLVKRKWAEIAAAEGQPVQGQYPDSPDAPGVTGSPVPTETPYDISRYAASPDDPARMRNVRYSPNPTVRRPEDVPQTVVPGTPVQTLGTPPVSQPPAQQTLVPAAQYDPNNPNQIPVQPPGNGVMLRAPYPIPGAGNAPTSTPVSAPAYDPSSLTSLPTEVQVAQADLNAARNYEVKPQKKWKDILAYIVQGANAAFNPQPGQKIVGYGQVKKDNAIRAAEQKLAAVQGEAMKNAQLKQVLEAPELAAARLEAQRQQKLVDSRAKLSKLPYFDRNNKLHRQMAIDVEMNPDDLGWDNRRADRMTVAGTTYVLDPNTKIWSPAQGLPTDKSEEVVEYEVTMPDADGKFTTRVFQVKSSDAAKFAMQMKVLDAQFEQRNKEMEARNAQEEKMLRLREQLKEQMTVRMKEIDSIDKAIEDARQAQNKAVEIELKAKRDAEQKKLAEQEKELRSYIPAQ